MLKLLKIQNIQDMELLSTAFLQGSSGAERGGGGGGEEEKKIALKIISFPEHSGLQGTL